MSKIDKSKQRKSNKNALLLSYRKEMRRLKKEEDAQTQKHTFKTCPKGIWHQGLKEFTASCEWMIGRNYFIRTVTHHIIGRLLSVTAQELFLEDAAWVAEDGRFSECLASGKVKEADPAPNGQCIVGRGSLIDAYPWNHPLIRQSVPIR